MSFNGGGQGKSGDYTISNNGTLTYNTSGGTLNSGYASYLLLVQIYKSMIFQDLIQEEIIHS